MNQHLILDQTCPIDNLKNNKQHTFTSSSTPSISQRISSFSLSSNSPIRRLRQHLRLVVTVPSPIRRRRPFSDSSLSTMMVGLVALSSDSEKKLKKIHPNSKLRWLDKAAIIESSALLDPEEQKHAGRLCTVTQVEESKLLLKMIPMWTTFLVVGMVGTTGDTFSSEQGKNLDSTDFTFYIVIFLKPISQVTISIFYNKLLNSKRASKDQLKLGKIVRIWSGMVLSTIFCVVAWRVEVHRLQTVNLKRNMSIFWLVPQYCLLGLMQGTATNGLDEFMTSELPKSLKNYASAMNGFVIDGIGSFLSILYVHANGKLFSTTMNESRLDKYYFRLLILSFLNMCYYYPISTIYRPIRYLYH
ncbi:hypothetical protein Q3G72_014210 [Acer saccharum]|nr:hypothetical protein Q3G72_014210 [Acer saccharum]